MPAGELPKNLRRAWRTQYRRLELNSASRRPGLGLGLNAHGLGVEDAVYEVRVKDGAEHNVGVGVGKVLARQCVGVLDAADVGGQHAVRPALERSTPRSAPYSSAKRRDRAVISGQAA